MNNKNLIFIFLLAILIVLAGCGTDMSGEAKRVVSEQEVGPEHALTEVREPSVPLFEMKGDTMVSVESETGFQDLDLSVNQRSRDNLNQIINEKGALWVVGENKFTGKSDDELKKMLGLNINMDEVEKRREEARKFKGQRYDLPDSFDWRNQHGENYVSPIKDQASCGSCWAFSAIGALEGHANAFYNDPNLDIDMSEQDLVSCGGAGSCGGGWPDLALNYIQQNRVCQETCFPYTATDISCDNKCINWQDDAWGITSWTDVPLVRDEIKNALITKGPLSIGMKVYYDFFDYDGGIYQHTTEDFAGYHAIVLVGYGQEDGLEYWIVKNSWGEDWGENGYFKILMGDSGIDSFFVFAVDSPNPTIPQQVICSDNDKDGYCNWGIGEKPANCPVCNDSFEDCDDSNSSIFENCGMSELQLGTLEVTSSPDDAKVYVKDLETGKYIYRGNSPLTFNLNPGVREIKVSKNHFEDYFTNITVEPNQTNYIYANLLEATEIFEPHHEIVRPGETLEIIGTAPGHSGFQNYVLEYGVGEYPQQWFTAGITLVNGGSQPIINGTLGFWDTSSISEADYYTIKLTVFGDGIQFEDSVSIYLDPTLKEGWPININLDGEGRFGRTPVIANVDGGNDLEIVIHGSHNVFVFKKDGTILNGWPQKVGCYAGANGPTPPPSVGDIDGDGENEIVVPRYSWWGITDDEGLSCEYCVYAWNSDGTPVDGWPIKCDDFHNDDYVNLMTGHTVIYDLNNDSKSEIIVNYEGQYQTENPATLIFNGDGTHFGSWPFVYNDLNGFSPIFAMGSPAVGDVDCDGEPEIVTVIEGDYNTDRQQYLYVFSKDGIIETRKLIVPWASTDNFFPILVDLDNNCDLEVVLPYSSGIKIVHHTGESLYDFWWGKQVSRQLSVKKIGEEDFQIVFGDIQGFEDGNLTVIDKNANVVWTRDLNGSVWVVPSLVDINNDGSTEIFTTSYDGKVHGFDANGNILNGFSKYLNTYSQSGVAIGDIDDDGKSELVAADWSPKLYVWDLEGNEGYNEWPMFQHDAQHTGLYVSSVACQNSTLTSCGETFPPDCNSLAQQVCCGDDSGENYKYRDCADTHPPLYADSCSDDLEDAACCDSSTDCVVDGVCYTTNTASSFQNNMWQWTNAAGTVGYYKCLNTPGMIYDCDQDPNVCQNFDWACNVDVTKPYGRAAGWAFEGENAPFGGYGDGWGRGIGNGGSYDQGPSSVINAALDECCGDDQGEYLITSGSMTRCCNSPTDTLDINGNCKAKPIKKTPVSEVPNP